MAGTYTHVTARDTREVWWTPDDETIPVLVATVHTVTEALEVEDRHRAEQKAEERDQ